jgi:hypothetical protein
MTSRETLDLDRVGRKPELADRNQQARFIFRFESKCYSHIDDDDSVCTLYLIVLVLVLVLERISPVTSLHRMLFRRETLKLGENGLEAGHADDLGADNAVDKIGQRGNRLDGVRISQIRIIINVEPENSRSSIARFRNLLQYRCDKPTGLAPVREEADQYRQFRPQNLRLEIRLIDFLNLVRFHRRCGGT